MVQWSIEINISPTIPMAPYSLATVPTFNSCTECLSNHGHNTRPHTRLPPSFLDRDNLTTERNFDSQATLVIDVLGLFFDMFVQPGTGKPDDLSIGAVIKCVYCKSPHWSFY